MLFVCYYLVEFGYFGYVDIKKLSIVDTLLLNIINKYFEIILM